MTGGGSKGHEGQDSQATEASAATTAVPRDVRAVCSQSELEDVMLGWIHEALNANRLLAVLTVLPFFEGFENHGN